MALQLGRLPSTAQWPRYLEETIPADAGHAVLFLGWTKTGVRVVSWGLEWELSFAEWNVMRPEYFAVHRVLSKAPKR